MENANAMHEAGVACAWVYEIRKPQLLDTPQSLKSSRLQHTPKLSFQFRIRELDKVVQGVAYTLLDHDESLSFSLCSFNF
jgi:hypothetical protein